jgi:CubicO group peptidase (beta-lactamase class C family)
MRKMTQLLLLCFVSICTLQAEVSFAADGAPGFVEERLDRIDDTVNAEIAAGKIPGAVALIMKDGNTVYHKSFGFADLASRKPMQNDAIFRIASMTKAITSVGVMSLYERGYFKLNDPISKFLPEFSNPQVLVSVNDDGVVTETRPASREISIVDLLTHSSGISYPFIPSPLQKTYRQNGVIDGVTGKNIKLKEGMENLAAQPLLFDPGSKFSYGLSTDVLGRLIEVVSGKPLDEFFAREIFTPLAMSDTAFYLPADKGERLVTLYSDVDGLKVAGGVEGAIELDNPRFPVEGAKAYFSGGAGLSSTAHDYSRFIEMLLNEGELDGNRILGRKSVELMRSPRMDMDGDGDADFGLGFLVTTDLGESGEIGSPGTYAWGGAFATSFWIDPEEQLIAVFMTQVAPIDSDIRDRFRTVVYQALE